MNILIIADEPRQSELKARIGKGHKIECIDESEYYEIEGYEGYDAIFDLNLEYHVEVLEDYILLDDTIIVTSGVKSSLAELVFVEEVDCPFTLIGLNDLPGFIGREQAEISLLNDEDAIKAIAFFKSMNWPCHIVKDRVGMVSARIVLMIINEAAYTLQEGTATANDIDQSMKLGTNYPFGPFEWSDMIGINSVYETLEALYHDTHDERYKVCPLLKTKYLKSEDWY